MSIERAIVAACESCEWTSTAPNARATAATHARSHAHNVEVVETIRHLCAIAALPGQTTIDDELASPA